MSDIDMSTVVFITEKGGKLTDCTVRKFAVNKFTICALQHILLAL